MLNKILSTVIFVSIFSISGCSKQDKVSKENTSVENTKQLSPVEKNVSEEENLSELFDVNQPQKDSLTVAKLSSSSAFMGLKHGMLKSLSPESASCITEGLDKNFIADDIQKLLKERLSDKELTNLNVFYESALGQKFIKYYVQELEVMSGEIKPTERYVKLSEDETKKMMMYNTSSLAKSMNKMYANNAINELIEAKLSDKVKTCGVEL